MSATLDLNFLQQWQGRTETSVDRLTPVPVRGLSATLDTVPVTAEEGAPLPPLWHWLYFLPQAPASGLGPDGHPRRGGFLPPVPLPRRMWAGSRFLFHHPLRMGDTVQRTSTIESVTHKQGRSGHLVFVVVRHDYRRPGNAGDALTEWHDIVYREVVGGNQAGSAKPLSPTQPLHGAVVPQPDGSVRQDWHPDPVLLFRYSALTFNGHRIHYDRSYVTEVEGYPGLIVHGPLIATLLVDLVRTQWPQYSLQRFDFKALGPLFDIHPFSLHARQLDTQRVELWASDWQGQPAMRAEAWLGL